MIQANEGEKPAERPEDGEPGPRPEPNSPAAEQADRQDKTKDKPDSGQNEDG